MKRVLVLLIVAALATAAQAATVAYWDMENSTLTGGAPTDGQPFDDGSMGNGYYGTLDSANGYLMRGWGSTYGPSFSSDTPTGTGFSSRHFDQDGYSYDAGLVGWTPSQWTIEATFKLDADRVDNQWWETLISRDGSSNADAFSGLYFQKTWDNYFRIDFATAGGERFEANSIASGLKVQSDRWYQMAATSDGTTLSLYVNDTYRGNGWQLVGQTDMSGAIDSTMAANAGNWVFGRGWYNGGQVDKITGNMDDIRFSDTALGIQDFITTVPEPATMVLLGLGALVLRRKK